jgi:hypothetical protein
MVKVGNEFEVNPLNYFYGNNHFEPTKLFYETYNVNNENEIIVGLRETEKLINKIKKLNNEQKRFSWNIELNAKLLELKQMYLKWTLHDIELFFLKNSPNFLIGMLQVTQRLKYLISKQNKKNNLSV